MKPTGAKNYGSIGHLPQSRLGPSDHHITEGQARICTEKARDKHDRIIVQEKLDGSNVGVAKVDGVLYPLARSGYVANTSPYPQHQEFYYWVLLHSERFYNLLNEGERAVGEWLYQAHGTRYDLPHEPFVLFDIMTGTERAPYCAVKERAGNNFVLPKTLIAGAGDPMPVSTAMDTLGTYGYHGAIDPIEGLVYRVERNVLIDKHKGGDRRWKVDFLAKYVQPDKVDGCYLESVTGNDPVFNKWPEAA